MESDPASHQAVTITKIWRYIKRVGLRTAFVRVVARRILQYTRTLEIARHVLHYTTIHTQLLEWERKGRPVPPPHLVKQRTVKQYGKRFSLRTLVETGTLFGEMVNATKNSFKRIISIELSHDLSERARRMFSVYAHISIVEGDSGEVLRDVLADSREPCLFWLDAHYSGGITARGTTETPIMQELRQILTHSVRGHVILVDDARLFLGRGGYPSIEELRELVIKTQPGWMLRIKDDIIRIHA